MLFGTGLPTVVKLVDKETLLKEREEKKRVWAECCVGVVVWVCWLGHLYLSGAIFTKLFILPQGVLLTCAKALKGQFQYFEH